ncbi:MarR family winged helix-turn-helix transcriptional regulator [Lacrimispora celerecrescens]|uniref:DNA-binding MarR family transcriptional regulator n=1 Tax=[Clostridium] celerecrescens 18A TaxID=1286362 RepID=A0A2M8Z7L1_9FIRM|nr:MarR family winged helix-turn-helix transcriptional regulator [Lacrimispora celerecrescens]PJJ29431.1 DNA-binding MarR family transcriptional regulator [[Clostridium] celerecrescens 18A]
MKNDILSEEHCPYCKRHCSLKAPHCGKGRALAEKRKKEEKKEKEGKKETAMVPETDEWKDIQSELRLMRLFQNVSLLLPERKARKQGGKGARLYIMAELAEKGDLTQKEIKENSGMLFKELEEALQKLEKKGCVSRKQEEGRDIKISLTGKGFEAAKEHMGEWKRENDSIFSPLTEEEKGSLEQILKKILS